MVAKTPKTPILLLILAIPLAIPALAVADAGSTKLVEDLLTRNLSGVASGTSNTKLGFSSDALVSVLGGPVHAEKDVATVSALARLQTEGTAKIVPGKAIIGFDEANQVAWFEVPYDLSIQPAHKSAVRAQGRFGGLAVHGKAGWEIAAADYAQVIPDAKLVARAKEDQVEPFTSAPILEGDATLAKAAADWVHGGLSAHAAAGATLAVSGTAPSELKTGKDVAKLVASWDKLGLIPRNATAKLFANGRYGFVQMLVQMPVKGSKAVASLSLAVAAAKVGDEWRWLVLQFSA